MKNLWQALLGIFIALASIGMILGGFSLSLAEGNIAIARTSAQTLTPTTSPTLQPSSTSTGAPTFSPTPSPSLSLTSSPTLTFTLTATLPPPPTNCPPPSGWTGYVVQTGDTLDRIATRFRTSSLALQQANCLLTTSGLQPGDVLYVPPLPTQTPISCGAPFNWVVYIVQPGDTLYHLSMSYGITVIELQRANCMGNANLLHTGQLLHVPPWAPIISSPTAPAPATATATMTYTPSLSLPTDTATEIPVSTSTDTQVPVPSDTPVEIPTDTLTPVTP